MVCVISVICVFYNLPEIKDDKDDIFAQISHEHYAKDLRTKGMLQFKVTPPMDSTRLKITALVETEGEFGQVQSSMEAYKSVSENDHFIHVRSSTKEIAVGRYVVFHVKTNFPFDHFDWMVLSKNIIIHSGMTQTRLNEFFNDLNDDCDLIVIFTTQEENLEIIFTQKSRLLALSHQEIWPQDFIFSFMPTLMEK